METVTHWLEHPVVAYFVILFLTGIVYQVAFARPLPRLKVLVVYTAMAVGCLLLLLFHLLRFPIVPILVITVILIVVARIRMAMTGKKGTGGGGDGG